MQDLPPQPGDATSWLTPCDQKRTILYAEYLAEELLLELPHRQFVFTVPKILRPYFKNDKRLFGEVCRLIFELLSGFFSLAAQRQLLCGCVASYQSFGEFARFHPHWHVLVLEGGFDEWGRFVYLPLGCDAGLLKLWQESILALFLKQKLIEQDRALMIRSWTHSGFSVESETRMLDKPTKEALGQYAVRGAVSEQRISYDSAADVVTWSARANGFFDGKIETFKGFEFCKGLGCIDKREVAEFWVFSGVREMVGQNPLDQRLVRHVNPAGPRQWGRHHDLRQGCNCITM